MTRAEAGKLLHMALKTVPGEGFSLRKRKKLIKAQVFLHLQPTGEGGLHLCVQTLAREGGRLCG